MTVWTRRRWLALTALNALPTMAARAAHEAITLLASWQQGERYFAGLLRWDGQRLHSRAQVELPTRAHGVWAEADGRALVVARRPGDWLLRWDPARGHCDWDWQPAGETLNGHMLSVGQGGQRRLLTTATDHDTGQGLVQVRDAATLAVRARWASGGCDPHAMAVHQGRLWVANGGIRTRPETGRAKLDLVDMDSSLVALDLNDERGHARAGQFQGHLHGQWRLHDPRLSLRHIAVNGDQLAVAIQAQHDDPQQRAQAPLLALFDGARLQPVPMPGDPSLRGGGYAGDIAALGRGFVVSATRGGLLMHWQASTGWQAVPLAEVSALAALPASLVGAGRDRLRWLGEARDKTKAEGEASTGRRRIDNHWVVTAPPRAA